MLGKVPCFFTPQVIDAGWQFPDFTGLSSKWDTGAEYVALFQNVLLGVHRDHYFAIILTPDGPEKTTEQIELYFALQQAKNAEFADMRVTNSTMWRTVISGDIQKIEGMQKGRYAPAYDGGKFSVIMDSPTHHFHKWVTKAICDN